MRPRNSKTGPRPLGRSERLRHRRRGFVVYCECEKPTSRSRVELERIPERDPWRYTCSACAGVIEYRRSENDTLHRRTFDPYHKKKEQEMQAAEQLEAAIRQEGEKTHELILNLEIARGPDPVEEAERTLEQSAGEA